MIKLVLVGLWACVITLASSYAGSYWKAAQAKPVEAVQKIEYRKTKEFTVPKIADGAIQGYIIVMLSYSVDEAAEKNTNAPPEVFLLDEAYRYLYVEDSIDFENMKKYDLQKFTKEMIQRVNTRMNAPILKEVLIQEFNYMGKADMKKQI
jgi:hypothetical protein